VLPGDPTVSLVSANRRELILQPAGPVSANGVADQLSAPDISVSVNGVPREFTTASNPSATQFLVDRLESKLFFGAPLPATGTVEVDYFLGQWQRTIRRVSGIVRLTVFGPDPAPAAALSRQALDGLGSGNGDGLAPAVAVEVGPVTSSAPRLAAWQRIARLRFEFELEVNEPDSDGGIIRKIPVFANLL
jgi:hypothetical protein